MTPATRAHDSTLSLPPRPGLLARLRNRYGLITSVQEDDGPDGRHHLVTVDYLDHDGVSQEILLWEAEPFAHCVEPAALPGVDSSAPMPLAEYRALIRATRWSALEPYIDPDGEAGPLDRSPLASPLHGAIQAEDYQMLPLWQAMRMPRVTLMLADDVGLGKTIEAGLILAELIRRRRARRILIVCPASLRRQWVQEMSSKFSLDFDIVDRPRTHELQRRFGMDVNPWRSLSRIVTSYDYLKQPDVLQSFNAASKTPDGSPHLPWDLLVVDEAHNLAPPPIGAESEVAKLLQQISPLFEHRLFLTATPHNGHTSCFTGLLEALDPVRFSRKWEPLTDAEKRRLDQVVIRRLKSQINEWDRSLDRAPRFADRILEEIPLRFANGEAALLAAFSDFRKKVRSIVASKSKGEERAGTFAVEILGKRLLSCPLTFADSWHRYQEGARSESDASADEVRAAERSAGEELADDREAERRRSHAVTTVGAWLRPLVRDGALATEMSEVDTCLEKLELGAKGFQRDTARSKEDARFNALCSLIDDRLREGDDWAQHERLVVFTEYKTTLDHLAARLADRYGETGEGGRIRVLFGGLEGSQREDVTDAFNDLDDPVRVLLATDTASEGLNLQESARLLLHYDVPWNPSRLEQRNGRLDRHGQARDVFAHHFSSEAEDDVRFLAKVVGKVHQQREDLESVGEVFDAALERRLVYGADADQALKEMDEGAADKRRRITEHGRVHTDEERHEAFERGANEKARLEALARELDLSPEALRETLVVALGGNHDAVQGPDDSGTFQLAPAKVGTGWSGLIDDHLRSESKRAKGTLRRLLFDPSGFLQPVQGPGGLSDRVVFRPDPNVALLHLGHPILHRALASFARFRFPGSAGSSSASRWTLVRGTEDFIGLPEGADALVLITVEEFAVNELRETFHHWVRTLAVPARQSDQGWSFSEPLPHRPASEWQRGVVLDASSDARELAEDLWLELEDDLSDVLKGHAQGLQADLAIALERELEVARTNADRLFKSRQGELSTLITNQTMERLEREIEDLRKETKKGTLFDNDQRVATLARDIASKQEEITRRKSHWESLRAALDSERDRTLERVLPRRHAMYGAARVFPVGVEIVLAGGGA